MKKFNVYAISDWPENIGQEFVIFEGKEFENKECAIQAAKEHYDDLEIVVRECKE